MSALLCERIQITQLYRYKGLKELKRLKKTIALLLCLIIAAALLPMSALADNLDPTMEIQKERSYKFNENYTLNGNWRDDIVSVAMAQLGKTRSQLGYTEDWCADFVCDCARRAKITNFPDDKNSASCTLLRLELINDWGADWHSYNSGYIPQKGDLVFYSNRSNTARNSARQLDCDHIGIITSYGFNSDGTVNAIEGNTSGVSSSCVNTKRRTVNWTKKSPLYIVGYVDLARVYKYDSVNPNDYHEPERDIYTYTYGDMTGSDVAWVQSVLYNLGYFTNTAYIDGAFGPTSRDQLKVYQQDNALKADGVVGEDTRVRLREQWKSNGLFKLNIRFNLDGVKANGAGEYATFDVSINGVKFAEDVNSFGGEFPIGTQYDITDIRPVNGKSYSGVSSGTRSGKVIIDTEVVLSFDTVPEEIGVETKEGYWNNHTYIFVPMKTTWFAARYISERLGGHLVTVTDAEEEAFVRKLTGNSLLWIGATDEGSEGDWQWITGEKFEYSNWTVETGEPSNDAGGASGAENYAQLWTINKGKTNGWNDGDGTERLYFVCELDRAPMKNMPRPSMGDVTGDGRINNADLVIIVRYVTQQDLGDMKAVVEQKADMNFDGAVDNGDIVILARMMVET